MLASPNGRGPEACDRNHGGDPGEPAHEDGADDLFGGPQGSPRTDKLIAASIQWAETIMRKIDEVFGAK